MSINSVLKANACFSMLCGVLCLMLSERIAILVGEVAPLLLTMLGVGLVIFVADVYWISRKLPQSKSRAWVIFWADVSWVLLTPVGLFLFAEKLTSIGIMIVIDIAIIVGVFAVLEWKSLKNLLGNGESVIA